MKREEVLLMCFTLNASNSDLAMIEQDRKPKAAAAAHTRHSKTGITSAGNKMWLAPMGDSVFSIHLNVN